MYLKELINKDQNNYMTDDKLNEIDINLSILINNYNKTKLYLDRDSEILMNYILTVKKDLMKNVLIHEKNQSVTDLYNTLTYMYIEVMNGVHLDKDIFINEIEISQ